MKPKQIEVVLQHNKARNKITIEITGDEPVSYDTLTVTMIDLAVSISLRENIDPLRLIEQYNQSLLSHRPAGQGADA